MRHEQDDVPSGGGARGTSSGTVDPVARTGVAAETASGPSPGSSGMAEADRTTLRRWLGDTVAQQTSERGRQLGHQAHDLAHALRTAGAQLDSEPGVGRMIAIGAERADRAAAYLEHLDGDRVLDDAEGLVRARPWVSAGLATTIGFAASRLLRASAERRFEASGRRSAAHAAPSTSRAGA